MPFVSYFNVLGDNIAVKDTSSFPSVNVAEHLNEYTSLNDLINALAPTNTLYFPAGNYSFNVSLTGVPVSIIADPNAIFAPATTGHMIYVTASPSFKWCGGSFQSGTYTTRTISSEFETSFIKVTASKNVWISDISVTSTLQNNIYLLENTNIILNNISINGITGTGIGIYQNNENVIANNIRCENVLIPTTLSYAYGFACGYTNYTQTLKPVKNIAVTNFYANNCEWEGFDCHGATFLSLTNAEINNCPRSITAYIDSRPQYDPTVEFISATFKNIKIKNTAPSQTADICTLYHYANTPTRSFKHITYEDCEIHNPYGGNDVFSPGLSKTYTLRNFTLTSDSAVCRSIAAFQCASVTLDNVRIDGLSLTSVAFRFGGCHVFAEKSPFLTSNPALFVSNSLNYIEGSFMAFNSSNTLMRAQTLLLQGKTLTNKFTQDLALSLAPGSSFPITATTTDDIHFTYTSTVYLLPLYTRITNDANGSVRYIIESDTSGFTLNAPMNSGDNLRVYVCSANSLIET